MEFWIARDKNKDLWLYHNKPTKYLDTFGTGVDDFISELDNNDFPEVTFENSPQKVKIELI